MTDSSQAEYNAYINSDEWREKARRIRERDGYRCQICGASDVPLEVHHLTYARLRRERDDDLITLCHDCHSKVTESWDSIKKRIHARKAYFNLSRSYDLAEELAKHLNALMHLDISFGGKYVLSDLNNIRAACEKVGIEYKFALEIQRRFNIIHVLDVVTQICNGTPRGVLLKAGYPKSLLSDISNRKQKCENVVSEISDELVCYLHDGKGKWFVIASSGGLEAGFTVGFMPSIRYESTWWDNE